MKELLNKEIKDYTIEDCKKLLKRINVEEKEICEELAENYKEIKYPLDKFPVKKVVEETICRFAGEIAAEIKNKIGPDWHGDGNHFSDWFRNGVNYYDDWTISNVVNLAIYEYFNDNIDSDLMTRIEKGKYQDAKKLLEKYEKEFESDYYLHNKELCV